MHAGIEILLIKLESFRPAAVLNRKIRLVTPFVIITWI